MNPLNFSLPFVFFLLSTTLLGAQPQAPPPEDENPFFRVEKVTDKLPPKDHKTIVGRLADGRILVQCAGATARPDGSGISRKFFWVKKAGDGTVEVTPSKLSEWGFLEMTIFSENTIYYTKETKGEATFLQGKLTPDDKIVPERAVPIQWDGKIENPLVFHLVTSDYPALIFVSKAIGRDDDDLYVSEFIRGSWTLPEPLSNPDVNTPYNERQPSVSPDGMLVFSSDRPAEPGTGTPKNPTSDLWFALPDYHRFWGKSPVNPLPAPFSKNTEDASPVVLAKNLRAGFFISNRDGKTFDLFTFASTDSMPAELPVRYHALLIAVDDYYQPDMPKLEKPIENARQLRDVLAFDYGFEVDTLENPTGAEIIEKLKRYQGLQENEYLLIAFFGHGVKMLRTERDSICALAGVDGMANGRNCIQPETMMNLLDDFIQKPRHVLLLLDACRSGLFQIKATRAADEHGRKSCKVFSSTISDKVPDESLFFTHLMSKLDAGPKNPNVAMDALEIYNYVEEKLRSTVWLPGYDDFELGAKGGNFPFPPVLR